MKLAISNIAWERSEEIKVFELMKKFNIQGLEIAPTKIWGELKKLDTTQIDEYKKICMNNSFELVAMQSLLYGKTNLKIFETEKQRKQTLAYLKNIIKIAKMLTIPSLVFGSPINRNYEKLSDSQALAIGNDFFYELSEFARENNVFICIEPNPKEYRTNFITTTSSARDFVKKVNHSHFRLHLDTGALILNKENIEKEIIASKNYVQHFHISNPFIIPPIKYLSTHKKIATLLRKINYKNWVSIEMKSNSVNNIENIEKTFYNMRNIYS